MATSTTRRPNRPKRDILRDLYDLTADLRDPAVDPARRENHLLESLA